MNVVVIRADQLRRSALPCYGNIESLAPAIDALAAESEVFTAAYSTEPECSAHRTTFFTGKHTHATPNGNKLDLETRTLHRLLDYSGVECFHVGKWHVTPDELKNPSQPQKVPSAILAGMQYHAGHEQKHALVGGPYWVNGGPGTYFSGPWRPQRHVDLFLAELNRQRGPFFGILDLEPPHTPYQDIVGTSWDIFTPSGVTLGPNVPQAAQVQAKQDLAHYYGMVFSVDAMVSQVMSALDSLGMLDDTMVVFTADHGAHIGAHGLLDPNEQKQTMHLEAIEVPLIIRHPDGYASINNTPWGTAKFYPYILDFFGVEYGAGTHWGLEPEGLLFEQLDGDNTEAGAWVGILKDGHRYARAESVGPWVLFEASDPYDQANLIGQGNPLEAEMEAALQVAAGAMGYQVPW